MEVLGPLDRAQAEKVARQIAAVQKQLDQGAAEAEAGRLRQQLAALRREEQAIQKRKRLTLVTVSVALSYQAAVSALFRYCV